LATCKWRIYYSDGSTFDSTEGEPHEAPTEGFICAVGYDFAGGRYIQHKHDFYCWHSGEARWWGVDRFGLHDLLRRNELYAYKEGRSVPGEWYRELMRRAHEDADFPR